MLSKFLTPLVALSVAVQAFAYKESVHETMTVKAFARAINHDRLRDRGIPVANRYRGKTLEE